MRIVLTTFLALAAVLWSGCGRRQNDATGDSSRHLHVDVPPHGGTPVALGDDYQIEWVLNASAGRLQAFFLDGEMENFVRIAPASFDITVEQPEGKRLLHLAAAANSATGEKVGSTSEFEVQSDWLKTNKTFAAVIPQIDVNGTTFSNIAFNFPK